MAREARGSAASAYARFILRRALLSLLVILGVVVIVFFLARVIPADPAGLWAGPHARAEEIREAREFLHLNDPPWVQFYYYMADLAQGTLGVSLRTHQSVLTDLAQTLPPTLELITASLVFALLVGIPLGIAAGIRQGSWVDHATRVVAIGGVSLPSFWLAVILQLLFVSSIGLLPTNGYVSDAILVTYPLKRVTGSAFVDALLQGNLPVLADWFRHLILPAITLASYPIGLVARMVRTMMIEVLGENYIRTARAYGLPARMIYYRLALKNAIAPAIVALGLSFAYSLTGAFLIENIFAWPGVGQYAWYSAVSFDYPAIMGVALVVAVFYVVVNLVVDLIQAFLDRRIVLAKREA